MPNVNHRWQRGLRYSALVAAAALLFRVVASADLTRVAELLSTLGLSGLLLVLLPQLASRLAETYGWKLSLRVLGHELGIRPLLRIRVATEALAQSLPAGIVFCESVKPLLLGRHCGLRVNESVAAIVVRKYLLVLSQAACVALLVALGFDTLAAVSREVIGVRGLEWLACGSAVTLLLLALAMNAGLRESRLAERTFRLGRRLARGRIAEWLTACERRFSETDRSVASFFRKRNREHAGAAFWFFVAWLIEAAETYLILSLLGADVDFFAVASVEVVLTFVRNVVFVVPAGLGIQDVGYVAFFAALGVPDTAVLGPAFVLLKRAKELFWMVVGYILLAFESKASLRRRPRLEASSA